ncbi:MAG: RapZ C-terminal domain-containing protein, partial [Acidimicrobiales bacterium]
VIDTGELNVHELAERIVEVVDRGGSDGLETAVVSFGFKHGLPLDADLVLDCRFLPNPHWVGALRPLTGLDEAVRDYVMSSPQTAAFLERVDGLLEMVVPASAREGRAYLSVAIGCTGGRHRSVVLAEEIAATLRRLGFVPTVHHRDIGR